MGGLDTNTYPPAKQFPCVGDSTRQKGSIQCHSSGGPATAGYRAAGFPPQTSLPYPGLVAWTKPLFTVEQGALHNLEQRTLVNVEKETLNKVTKGITS